MIGSVGNIVLYVSALTAASYTRPTEAKQDCCEILIRIKDNYYNSQLPFPNYSPILSLHVTSSKIYQNNISTFLSIVKSF